jgi:hypothetical protein
MTVNSHTRSTCVKHILSVKNPSLSSYWYYADLVSVVATVDEKNWYLANNYNNIFCDETADNLYMFFTNMLSNSSLNIMNMYFECPFLDFQKINKNYLFSTSKIDLIDFVKKTINQGYYILLLIDRHFIKQYGFERSSNHEIMIYGYNDKENLIYFCDNTRSGLYSNSLTSTYDSFILAFYNTKVKGNTPFAEHLYLIKPYKNPNYLLDTANITSSLGQYLHLQSEPSCDLKSKAKKKIVSGIQVYDSFIRYLERILDSVEDNYKKDIRSFCVLWDHKKSVLVTLSILYENNYVDEHWITAYQKIENRVLCVRNLMLKFFVSNNRNIIKKIINELNEIRAEEHCVLEGALKNICHYSGPQTED